MVVMQFDFGPVRVVFAWRSSGLGEFFSLSWGGRNILSLAAFLHSSWRGEVNQSCSRDHAELSSHMAV